MTTINDLTNQFTNINRALVAADLQEEWDSAALLMHALLDNLGMNIVDLMDSGTTSGQAKLLSLLLTVMAEAGQYRHEQYSPYSDEEINKRQRIDEEYLPLMGDLRNKAIRIAKEYFSHPTFITIYPDLQREIYPLLDSMDFYLAPDRFMPFRVIQIGNIVERLLSFKTRTSDMHLVGDKNHTGLLQAIYDRKYLRFGTSGVRGRWQVDFTEKRAKQVAQAICDFLRNQNVPGYVGAEDLSGKRVVIGYDSRRNARQVAEWVAQVCLANGFKVELANRDTPTPALVFYLTDYLKPEEVAGLINCTASHNPPEWQGIKFNPRLGFPAPTNITDFIAFRINELELMDHSAQVTELSEAEARGMLKGFDPISHYAEWIFNNGNGNARIPLDTDTMRAFYQDKLVVVDEMYGAGRGYLTKLLSAIGIRHVVIHAERDPDLPGLDYANPEEPYIEPLKKAVVDLRADIGVGMDTDADRYGVVDRGGMYYRSNQVLTMLVRYLGMERKMNGRVIATQTGSPIIEVLAGQIPNNEDYTPREGAVPLYVRHPFYRMRLGEPSDRVLKNAFLVPVGIKYIEEIRRLDRDYRPLKPLPDGWRDTLLIGGEESSGLTTRGHVTDKDGIWANLLILEMIAHYAQKTYGKIDSLSAIWRETVSTAGCWNTFGGKEAQGSNSGRLDVDAVLEAKEALIDYFLDYIERTGEKTFEGMEIVFLGGIRYDIAEMQLKDAHGNDRHYLRVRASGTEPINRIYVESSDPIIAERLIQSAGVILEKLSIDQVKQAQSEWRLVDIISQSKPGDELVSVVKQVIVERGWDIKEIIHKMEASVPTLEHRTRKIAETWIKTLGV